MGEIIVLDDVVRSALKSPEGWLVGFGGVSNETGPVDLIFHHLPQVSSRRYNLEGVFYVQIVKPNPRGDDLVLLDMWDCYQKNRFLRNFALISDNLEVDGEQRDGLIFYEVFQRVCEGNDRGRRGPDPNKTQGISIRLNSSPYRVRPFESLCPESIVLIAGVRSKFNGVMGK